MNSIVQGWLPSAMLIMVLLLTVSLTGCITEKDGDDDGGGGGLPVVITINGVDHTVADLLETLGTEDITVDNTSFTGIPLDDIIVEAGINNADDRQYNISAADGYYKHVTWADMSAGVLIETDTMTAFPGLPGKYRIRDVVSIQTVDAETLEVGGKLYTWRQPFDIVGETEFTAGNDTLDGVPLGDIVNLTVSEPAEVNFTLHDGGGHHSSVNWTVLSRGYLVDDGHRAVLPELEAGSWVDDLVRIEIIS